LSPAYGLTRFLYNWDLKLCTNAYYRTLQKMFSKEISHQLTQFKQNIEYVRLEEVTAVPLEQALKHLNTTFINFFVSQARYLRFKKKRNQQSAIYASNNKVDTRRHTFKRVWVRYILKQSIVQFSCYENFS
jgi:putative transposase